MDRTAREQVPVSKQPHSAARGHSIQGPGEKPAEKCQTKAGPSSQQGCQAAEEKFHKISRCIQQEGDARHSEQETGQQKASARVRSDQEDNKEAMLSNRWTGQQGASVKQLGGQEVIPDSQANGQSFGRTPPHSQQVERIKK